MKRALMTSMISLAFLAGCAADMARYQAETQQDAGNPEAALKILKQQIASSPNDIKLRAAYQSSVSRFVNNLLVQADQARAQGNSGKQRIYTPCGGGDLYRAHSACGEGSARGEGGGGV